MYVVSDSVPFQNAVDADVDIIEVCCVRFGATPECCWRWCTYVMMYAVLDSVPLQNAVDADVHIDVWQSSRPASFSPAGLILWPSWLER